MIWEGLFLKYKNMKLLKQALMMAAAIVVVLVLIWLAKGFLNNVVPGWWAWLLEQLPLIRL